MPMTPQRAPTRSAAPSHPTAAKEPAAGAAFFIEMDLPPRTSGRRPPGELMQLIDAMSVDPRRMLFVPLPEGTTLRKHADRLRQATYRVSAKSDGEKKFEIRPTKSGAAEGVGVWRIE